MAIRPTKRVIIWLLAVIIVGVGTYGIGRSGLNVGRMVTESRCSSGAFIQHSDNAAGVAADAGGDAAVTGINTITSSRQEVALIGQNLVPNPGAEAIGDANTPAGWLTNIYGNNNATFTVVAGHDSGRAIRTQITNYPGGDADWYYQPVDVQPGHYYAFSDYYRSDVSTRAILAYSDGKGQPQYINLTNTGPSATWAKYQDTFFVPATATKAAVFHPLAARGYLEADDFQLAEAHPTGFSEPLLSLTFDDGWKSIHDNALPIMKRYNLVSTQYIISGYLGQDKDYMSPANVYDFTSNGHEVGSHTVDHADLTKLTSAQAEQELARSQADLGHCYSRPTDFAAPYGTYNTATTKLVQAHYQTARSTDVGFNTADNFSHYGLLVQNVTSATSQDQLRSWIATAQRNRAWLILVYHQVEKNPSAYARQPADFEQDLKSIKSSGIKVLTMQQSYKEIQPQLK